MLIGADHYRDTKSSAVTVPRQLHPALATSCQGHIRKAQWTELEQKGEEEEKENVWEDSQY